MVNWVDDLSLYYCKQSILPLFNQNFDFRFLKRDLISTILTSEVLFENIYVSFNLKGFPMRTPLQILNISSKLLKN